MPAPAPPSSSEPKLTSRAWYIVAGGLLMIAAAIGGTGLSQALSTIEEMNRVVMPGKAEIVLPAGRTTLYAERESQVAGKAYSADREPDYRCEVTSAAGQPVTLQRSAATASYAMGGYAGHSVFDVHVEVAGSYVLACEAPRPFVLAIGQGIGSWIVVGAIGALVPGLLAVLVFGVVFVKRRRQSRDREARRAAP